MDGGTDSEQEALCEGTMVACNLLKILGPAKHSGLF